jgi:hypothetical protein
MRVGSMPAIGRRSAMAGSRWLLAVVCAFLSVQAVGSAKAQCLASNVRHKPVMPKEGPLLRIGADAPVWKRVSIGTYGEELALRNALDQAGCAQGELAEQILARSSFRVSAQKAELELVLLSARNLGIQTETARIADVYARAQTFGFRLAPAEVGPQLRLQYLDQPVGEVLHIGMEPLGTGRGQLVIFVVANGAEGLMLIGQDVAVGDVPSSIRFLFVRPAGLAADACSACTAVTRDAAPR